MGNLSTLYPAGASNNILEIVDGVADGRTVTTNLSSYTYQTVSAVTQMSTTLAAVAGTSIDYTPPSDAKSVSYKCMMKWCSEENSGISHFYLYVDSTLVIPAYVDQASQYSNGGYNHGNFMAVIQYVFDLTADSDDIANGKFASWTSDKTLQVRAREYSSSYEVSINSNQWEDGSGASGTEEYDRPVIQIIAYS